MRLSEKMLSRHVYVIGGSGVGKSRAMESWAVDLMRADQGVGVIDPHGELYHNLVARIARHGKRLYERVVLFDPLHPTHKVGFNPLELHAGEVAERKAQFLASIIAKLFHADPLLTARMQRILFYTFWLLTHTSLTLLEFEDVLTNPMYRNLLLQRVSEGSSLRRYWQQEFPTQERLVKEWTQSSLNKVGALVTDPDFALILGQQQSTINFRSIMDEGRILLVHLPKGLIGEGNSHLMGAFIVAQIQQAVMARAGVTYRAYRPFTLFIDEFHNYATDDIHEILAETRKYRLALVMAHQYYAQLSDNPKLQAAVLNTVGNLVVFRVGAQDAEQLMQDLFTPDLDVVKDVRTRRLPTGIKWFPFTTEREIVWRPLDEIWAQEARRLTQLPDRQYWYKQRGQADAQQLRTRAMPDVVLTSALREAIATLTQCSAEGYAKPRAAIAAELAQRRAPESDEGVPPFGVEEDL